MDYKRSAGRRAREIHSISVLIDFGGMNLHVCFLVIFVNYVFTQLAQSYLIT